VDRPAAKDVAAQPFSTARLRLVPLTPDHADELAAALDDPCLHEFIGGEPLDVTALRAQIERWAAGSPDPSQSWLNWAISLDSALVGTLQATVYDDGDRNRARADVAWVVGVAWQGQGIAREAAVALVDRLLAAGLDSVSASIHPGHRASQRVAAAAGLTPTDTLVDGEVRWERTA
jgi:RimJ/RimL family protein N-acetyltransferase